MNLNAHETLHGNPMFRRMIGLVLVGDEEGFRLPQSNPLFEEMRMIYRAALKNGCADDPRAAAEKAVCEAGLMSPPKNNISPKRLARTKSKEAQPKRETYEAAAKPIYFDRQKRTLPISLTARSQRGRKKL